MTTPDRDEIIQQLRALLAGRGDGIDLDTPFHWALAGVKQPEAFFQHLPVLLPPDSILYFEGTSIGSEPAAFYSAHRAAQAVEVARDTIAPVPDVYHVRFSAEVTEQLRALAARHAVAEMCDHLKAYRGRSLLLYFHDAFDGTLRISEHLGEETVAPFARALGVPWQREETGRRDPELLRQVLRSLEHPEEPAKSGPGDSWARRLWKRLTGR